MVAFFTDPVRGAAGLLGAAVATGVGMLLGVSRPLLRSGLLGCNGALIGLAWAAFLQITLPLTLPLVIASALSAVLLFGLVSLVSIRWRLPVLSLPFILVTWASFLAMGHQPGLPVYLETTPYLAQIGEAEALLRSIMPYGVGLIFRVISAIFFQDSVLVGMACFLGLALNSRVSALFAALGGYVGILFFLGFGDPAATGAGELVMGFNSALVAMALGGIFIRLSWQAAIYALLAAAASGIITMSMDSILGRMGLPVLAGPFNLVSLLFIAVLRSGVINVRSRGLSAVPLEQVRTPDVSAAVKWKRRRQSVRLTLPFYGKWYVSQGNQSPLTHWGRGSYAWDFVVVDERGRTYQEEGIHAEDYYAFGLPVIAPAPGRVVRVVDDVVDNVPPQINEKQNWGNLVIIDHGNGEFSEISHFRRKDIIVREGETVLRGQFLGHVGNSGRSMEPHLHYQLQREDRTGARTLSAKFSDYLRHDGDITTLLKQGVPQQGELVSNLHQ